MKHYDCHGQKFYCEVFHSAASQQELLAGIAMWWLGVAMVCRDATMDSIKFDAGDEGFIAEVMWSR